MKKSILALSLVITTLSVLGQSAQAEIYDYACYIGGSEAYTIRVGSGGTYLQASNFSSLFTIYYTSGSNRVYQAGAPNFIYAEWTVPSSFLSGVSSGSATLRWTVAGSYSYECYLTGSQSGYL
jgi:hypothetical protein